MRFGGAQLLLRLDTIDRLKFGQRRQQPGDVFAIAGMHHVEVECAVKNRAYASHDNKVNAMPGEDFQYVQKSGIRTLHGV
jgi:hypothetical protein